MKKAKTGIVISIVVIIVVLSLIDVASNIFSFIPWIGSLFETMQESLNESLQILLTAILGGIALRRKP